MAKNKKENQEQTLKKTIMCYKLNLESSLLCLFDSIYMELSIYSASKKRTSQLINKFSEYEGMINVLEWRHKNDISEYECTMLYEEWLKSKNIDDILSVNYEFNINKEEFYNFIRQLFSDFDPNLTPTITHYFKILKNELEKQFIKFKKPFQTRGWQFPTQDHIHKINKFFQIFDEEDVGIISFDKCFFLFLTLYGCSLDKNSFIDCSIIKKEFRKFLSEVSFFENKITFRNLCFYLIQNQLYSLDILERLIKYAQCFADFLTNHLVQEKKQKYFPNILDLSFLKTLKFLQFEFVPSTDIRVLRQNFPDINVFYMFFFERFFISSSFQDFFEDNLSPEIKYNFLMQQKTDFEEYYGSVFLETFKLEWPQEMEKVFLAQIDHFISDILISYQQFISDESYNKENISSSNKRKEKKVSNLIEKCFKSDNESSEKNDINHLKETLKKSIMKSPLKQPEIPKINNSYYSCPVSNELNNKRNEIFTGKDFVERNINKIKSILLSKEIEKSNRVLSNYSISDNSNKSKTQILQLPNFNKLKDIQNSIEESALTQKSLKLDLSSFQKNESTPTQPMKTALKPTRFHSIPKKTQKINNPSSHKRNYLNNYNKSKTPEKKKNIPSIQKTPFNFCKIESFEKVMERLNQKGSSAEKPRRAFK